MIRVNLLPQKREGAGAGGGGQAWLVVLLVALFVETVGLFAFHQLKRNELAKQQQVNAEIEAQVRQSKKNAENHPKVKEELAAYRAREEAIDRLQAARTGPTAVLLELSRVLTTGRGPTVDGERLAKLRAENPTAVPSATWDARRLWLTGYRDQDRLVTLEGLARDGDDVSELARRLALSSYFDDVKLLPASKIVDAETKVELVKFQLSAKANY